MVGKTFRRDLDRSVVCCCMRSSLYSQVRRDVQALGSARGEPWFYRRLDPRVGLTLFRVLREGLGFV